MWRTSNVNSGDEKKDLKVYLRREVFGGVELPLLKCTGLV